MVRSSGDVVWWTKRISALARSGRAAEAVAEFARMDAAPNALTLASVLPACARLRSLTLGRAIHGFWLRRGGGPGANSILDNAVLDVYAKCGDLRSARFLFDRMLERDVFSWTAIVWGLARSGSPQDAVAMFRAMISDGETAPNEATIVSVLHAVASTGSLACGKVLHSCVLKRGLDGEQVVGNALMDAYAKCGEARLAFQVFDPLPDKEDLVSWGTVMRAMAVHGRCREALQLFSMMLRRGALHILGAMRWVYGIAPWREHYTCVLDAFGRAGHIDGAAEIFRRMPMECDQQVLGAYCSYASSSKVNGISCERFWERFADGEVDAGGGTYALMSRSMAGAGQWDDACAVRETMAARRIEKAAACTWIEV
ncbi:hypothetical protein ACQ4PT_029520 [Festuca glaucescens]